MVEAPLSHRNKRRDRGPWKWSSTSQQRKTCRIAGEKGVALGAGLDGTKKDDLLTNSEAPNQRGPLPSSLPTDW